MRESRGPFHGFIDTLAEMSRMRDHALGSGEQRTQATSLWRALQRTRERVLAGERDGSVLERVARQTVHEAGVTRVDYVSLRDAETLARLHTLRDSAILLIAAHVGSTRLIDNCRLTAAAAGSASSREVPEVE